MPKQMRAAEVRGASYNADDNSVELIWSTGAVVRRRGPSGPFDEQLLITAAAVRLDRLNAGAPLLNSHADWSLENIIGSVIEGTARIEGAKGVARVRLSTAAGDADNVAKVKGGVIRSVSVGYVVHAVEITERDGSVPLWTARDWEPLELSLVAIPADPGAHVRSASADLFPCELRHASRAAIRPAFDAAPGWYPPLR
jgi:phage head maturation protease